MKNKKLSTTSILIALLLPLLVIIGVATWYITTNVNATPEYSFSDVVKFYLNNKEMTYNGKQAILDEHLVDCTIQYKKYGSQDETVTGSPMNAGEYTIIVTDAETQESVEVKYTIKPRSLEGATITLENDTFIYLGTGNVTPDITKVVVENLELEQNDYDISYSNNTGVGKGLVTITGKGNFTGTATKEFEIVGEDKDMIIELGADTYSMEYNKEEFEFGDLVVKSEDQIVTNYEIEYSFKLQGETDFTVGKPVNAGVYFVQVTVNKKGYKEATKGGFVTITKREIELSWTNTENATYDGLPHQPTVEATNIIEGDEVSLTVNFDNLIDAKIYSISVQGINGSDKNNYKLPSASTISYTINPRPIKLKTETYEMNYDSNKRTWDLIKTELKNKAVFIDDDGKVWTPKSFEASGMYDGSFGYGDSSSKTGYMKQDGSNAQNNTMVGIDSSYSYVVGSTYLVTYKVTDSNFKLQSNSNLFKYKTAKIGSTYYTIEDAISASGNISFPGDSSAVSSYVYTAFCNLTDSEGYPYSRTQYLNGKRLVVSCKDGEDETKYSQSVTSGNVYSALYIPKTITLNLNSSAELLADATIGFAQPNTTISCNRGVVFNNGTINVKSGCKLNAYGYVKGNGLVKMESGSNTVDCMHTYDWPGGNAAISMYKSVLPTNAWSAHNISCTSQINAGAEYQAAVYVVLSKIDAFAIATLIGSSSTSNCLFKGISGYVLKSARPATEWAKTKNSTNYKNLYIVNGTNQQAGQRDDVKICGEYEDSTLNIEMNIIITVSLQTNTSKPATVGFMDISVEDGATFNLNKSDYLFFPGATFKVAKGGTVNIGANVDVTMLTMSDFTGVTGNNVFTSYCVDKVDSKAIINGNLNVNGNIGGLWTTEEAGAIINASNGNVSSSYKMFTSFADPYYVSGNKTSIGNIDNVENTNLQKMSYISTGEDTYHWTAATNVKTFKLNFYDGNELLTTKDIQVVNGNTYTLSGNEYVPTKEFYDFDCWKLNDGSIAAGNILTDGTNNEINLYASWTETEYSFGYSAGYGVDEDGNVQYVNATYENIINSFTIKDFKDGLVLDITTTASYEGKNFIGWYVGVDTSIGRTIDSITIDQLRMFIEQYQGIPIPLYCEFTDDKVINVKYTTEIGASNITTDTIKSGESITLPDMNTETYNDYINNNLYNKYFVGWRVQGTTDILSAGTKISYNQFTGDVTFEAVWNDKVTINLIDAVGWEWTLPNKTYYLKQGDTLTLSGNVIDVFDNESTKNIKYVYKEDGWTINGGQGSINVRNFTCNSDYGTISITPIMTLVSTLYKFKYTDDKGIIKSLKYSGTTLNNGSETYIEFGKTFEIDIKNTSDPTGMFANSVYFTNEYGNKSNSFNQISQNYKAWGSGSSNKTYTWNSNVGPLFIYTN